LLLAAEAITAIFAIEEVLAPKHIGPARNKEVAPMAWSETFAFLTARQAMTPEPAAD